MVKVAAPVTSDQLTRTVVPAPHVAVTLAGADSVPAVP
jgi:hypothetical protein